MSNVRDYLREKKNRTRDSFEFKIFRHRMSTFLIIAAIILFVAVVVIFFVLQWRNRIYTYYETMLSTEREVISGTEDIRLGSAILTYSRDGAHCTDSKGNVLWNQTYGIHDPIIDINENVAVIADYNGRDVYVVSDSGILGKFSTNLPIRNVTVSADGIVGIVMADTEVTYYNIYSAAGEMLYEGQATMNSSGYPAAFSLSPNGELWQISYIYLDAGVQKSNIAFYNLGEVGNSRADFFVGAYPYDLFVPYVHFLNDNVSFAVGDSQLMIYHGNRIPKEAAKFSYTEEVKSVFHNDEYIGLVFYADSGDSLYKMNVYSAAGNEVGSYYFNIEYTDIFFNDNYFVVYNDAECVITTLGHVEKFNGSFTKNVRRMVPLSGSYRFLLVTNDSLDVIRLR